MNLRGARRDEIDGVEPSGIAEPIPLFAPTEPDGRAERRLRFAIGALALLTFIVHVLAASRMRGPIIHGDEAGYLGNARYLAHGIGRTHAGYAFGYSVLLAPAAFLAHDPINAYHLSLVVNAFLAASVPILGIFLARRVFPATRTPALVVTALLLVLYPGWSAMANLTLSENALVPTVLAIACVIAVARQVRWRWCLAAALSSYAVFVSPRGILVVAAFAVACLVSTWPVRRSSPAVPALGLAFVLTLVSRGLNIVLAGTSRVPGVSDGFGTQVFRVFLHPSAWGDALANILGRFVYTTTATLGVVLIGFVVLSVSFVRRRVVTASRSIAPVAAFAVPVLFLTLVLGALASAKASSTAIDYLVYGRYVDAVLAPAFAVGGAWLFGKIPPLVRSVAIVRALVMGGALAVAVAVFALVRPDAPPSARLNVANVLALRVYLTHIHRSLPIILLAAVAVMTVVLVVTALDRRVGAVVMIVFFAWSSWVVYNGYLVHDSIGRAQQRVIVDGIDRLRALGVDASCVIVESPLPSMWHVNNYRFLEPHSTFPTDGAAHPDCGPLILSNRADVKTRFPSARPVSYENYIPIGLWVDEARVPRAVVDQLSHNGLVGPVPITGALPDSASRSSITIVPPSERLNSRDLRFGVHVTHTGTGAPWPGSFSALQSKRVGVVRLHVELGDVDNPLVTGSCSLPHTMFPGDDVDIDCDVPVSIATARRYEGGPAGRLTLRVGLEQIGVGPFSERGDRVAEVEIPTGDPNA